jgi:hypothetical protein
MSVPTFYGLGLLNAGLKNECDLLVAENRIADKPSGKLSLLYREQGNLASHWPVKISPWKLGFL